ncbi:Protein argonaute 2 [Acorus calamus]|uniref:Protein argonaute 2 n=1 Tax=Acorus calamus TaxID=4465 RepID=A0AAV9CWY7_ACOCL|nr:Protein argonaute 2 [Acorus calamus]
MRRPDRGGTSASRYLKLLINHFLVHFDCSVTIYHHELTIEPDKNARGRKAPKPSKSDSMSVRRKLFATDPARFQLTAYDGDKNLFGAVRLPTGTFRVTTHQSYTVKVSLLNEIRLSETVVVPPRNTLQALDVILREKPSAEQLVAGRCFYWKDLGEDLQKGIQALDGFIQGFRVTGQGLVVYVDYSVMAFRKRMPVIDFLQETLQLRLRENCLLSRAEKALVENALRGLRVMVNHRNSSQRYTVKGLTKRGSDATRFTIDGPNGLNLSIDEFFWSAYKKRIMYKSLPCLDLSCNGRMNYVPMEFCDVAEGQRYPKERLSKPAERRLREIALANPERRKDSILNTVRSLNSPYEAELLSRCGLSISKNMTEISGRVLQQPDLRLRAPNGQYARYKINRHDGQWNLTRHKVPLGARIDRWAILDFSTSAPPNRRLDQKPFVYSLVNKLRDLGVHIAPVPLFLMPSSTYVLSNPDRLSQTLVEVTRGSRQPQILICPMVDRHDGYKTLKLLCETKFGLPTQCCLTRHANNADPKKRDQFLANLALKINAKLGGSNVELFGGFPAALAESRANERFMLIGADVNHPSVGSDESTPSIAAMVGSINWPALNKYAARVRAQPHRTEQILAFGDMVRELVEVYARVNKGRPGSIIVFRDGVGDNQFEMVLNKEFLDLKEKLGYSPKITIIIAQKRHHTRCFPKEGGASGSSNMPPGTVVDTVVVHPTEFDFYLCSHQGLIGTSKPTHYHVLLDDIGFSSDEMQKMIYHLCFTFARCTKPVSLVPPVYYADIAAYRGRVYHEGLMIGLNSPGSVASASMSSSASAGSNVGSLSLSSLASPPGSVSLPKLHKDIEDNMLYL